MLEEYFSIKIDKLGCLRAIPLLFEDYVPPLHFLPLFLINLATKVICGNALLLIDKVNWDAELPCFKGISEQIADFYSIR
jgi:hypothetical protein